MRDIEGRNKARADEMRAYAKEQGAAGKPADQQRLDAYARYDGLMNQVGERLSTLTPEHADPQPVADDVVRIVNMAAGTRPARSVIDFVLHPHVRRTALRLP